MRWIKNIIVALLLSSFSVQAQDESFRKAQTAYDDGRYAEAILLYDSLLKDGLNNPEIHYNLGNACFKDSDLPKAILHYRKAWYDLPRDPDIVANLHFALNAAGAIEHSPGFAERILFTLSYQEWILVATAGYLLLSFLLLLIIISKRSRRLLFKLCLIPGLLILLSTFGWLQWRQLQANPEWVVSKTEATALFGPVDGSTAHFKLPIGALVQQSNIDPKGWIEVEYDGKKGWLKNEYITPVSP
ncbi:tetratricopeptide repeat protein [Pontiellaceae bacterium B1224]|nr:tetratricopeptide repeat protein [Pontiellaceae bacterium B1224]